MKGAWELSVPSLHLLLHNEKFIKTKTNPKVPCTQENLIASFSRGENGPREVK